MMEEERDTEKVCDYCVHETACVLTHAISKAGLTGKADDMGMTCNLFKVRTP